MPPSGSTGTRPAPLICKGHTHFVWSVAFAPDGNSLASGSRDSTLRTWNPYNPSLTTAPLTGHTDSIRSVSYSPAGDIIASASADKTIRLWDASTRRQLGQPLEGHTRHVRSVAFSPDGRLIASGSLDKTVRLWDVKSRQPMPDPFEGHTHWVRSVAFTTDSARVVSGSSDTTIRIWDVEHRQTAVGPLYAHTSLVLSVAVSPDGSQIISGSEDKTLQRWDLRSGEIIDNPYQGHTGGVRSVSFSPSGIYVASGSKDGTVRVWDIRTGRQLDEAYEQHTGEVTSVAFSPNGIYIASASDDTTVMIWDVSGGGHDTPDDSQGMIDNEDQEPVDKQLSIQDMFDLLAHHGCADIGAQVDPTKYTTIPISQGGFGDIWRGELVNGTGVAIKVWRGSVIEQCEYKTLKRVTREIHHWSKMKHENVHELMGVVQFMGQSIGMVSEWMVNGNLHDYLRRNPSSDRHELSIQVASGLVYIHNFNMIHGDIKALNVLVSDQGVAKLTDFGLATMSEASLQFSVTTTQAGSIRWAAPELLLNESAKSKGSDVYALGMTILETFTGNFPYSQFRQDFTIIQMVAQGTLPTRPTNKIHYNKRGNQLWGLLIQCWDRNVAGRPTAQQVAESLSLISTDRG